MAYKAINEKLCLWSCGIEDITFEQANVFLQQWEAGAPIGSLTVFADYKNKRIVINHDHRDYLLFENLCLGYMQASWTERLEMSEKFKHSSKIEVVKILDEFTMRMEAEKDMFLISKQDMTEIDERFDMKLSVAKALVKEYADHSIIMVYRAFSYGVMQGKRMEREKKGRKLHDFK